MAEKFSNFNFLHGVNEPLFKSIFKAERLARTNFRECGHITREAYEIFINAVLKKAKLADKVAGDLSLKIKSLRNPKELKAAGYLSAGQTLSKNIILPDLGTVDYTNNMGKRVNEDYYDFLRKFGNACSHSKSELSDPKETFENVEKCLQGFHLLFSQYYEKGKKAGTFNAGKMPIGEYYITKSYVPDDKNRSKCKREYLGYILRENKGDQRHSENQYISYHAILRQYNKEDVDSNFLLRNSDVFLEASRSAIYGAPPGMTDFRTVVGLDNPESSFYITAHLFWHEPQPLYQHLLAGTSLKQRLELCSALASCFYNLHNADEPIYHRLLTYESIVVCKFNNRLIPYVIKFDYGKLTSAKSKPYTTVFIQAQQAEASIQKGKSLTKYLAPEWKDISADKKVDWEKIDIYSLGVLFSDILVGRFDSALVTKNKLTIRNRLSDDLLDELSLMTSEKISNRNSVEYIQLALNEELRKYK